MGVTIVTDSGGDLTIQEAAAYGIEIVPGYIIFGNERFRDGVDIDRAEFTRRLNAGEKPRTEPTNVKDFETAFESIVASGNQAVVVALSSNIGNVFDNAKIAAASFGSEVYVVDSLAASGLESLIAVYAAERARAGESAGAIAEKLQNGSIKTAGYFAVRDLAALGQAERLPKAVIALGSMLDVSLVLKINEQGTIAPAGQSRSYEKTRDLMLEAMIRTIEDSPGAWVAISHAGDGRTAHSMSQTITKKLGHVPVREFVHETSLTIASNLGNTGVGIFAIVP